MSPFSNFSIRRSIASLHFASTLSNYLIGLINWKFGKNFRDQTNLCINISPELVLRGGFVGRGSALQIHFRFGSTSPGRTTPCSPRFTGTLVTWCVQSWQSKMASSTLIFSQVWFWQEINSHLMDRTWYDGNHVICVPGGLWGLRVCELT